ncbi:MAG: hypothetical protein ACK2U9_09010, partial [Anaerolineae bacterium]
PFESPAYGWERLARFEDFSVWRGQVPAGGTLALPAHPSYALCMAVGGPVRIGPLTLAEEQAAFVPGWLLADSGRRPVISGARPASAGGSRDEPTTSVLLAAPDL